MDPVQPRPYTNVSTDSMLSQTMEGVGDHDPSTIQKDTGAPLHFDATRSASIHRAAAGSDKQGVKDAADAGMDQAREKATERIIDGVAELSGKFGGAISGTAFVVGSVVQLGQLYYQGIEKAKHEGDNQKALGASDAGVTAMAQTLDYSPSFRSDMTTMHNGSSNVAAAMTTSLRANPAETSELQLRSDKGFVDAAGYAKNAAAQMKPLYDQARSLLSQAKTTSDPKAADSLRSQAASALSKAADVEKKTLAPVLGKAQTDAAYGLGVLYAMHSAMNLSPAAFDATFNKANANVISVSPPTVHIQG
jgi:hypothetical protein